MPGDIKDTAHCRAIIETAVKAFGKLDVLVNNAAHQASFESIEDISDDEWDVTFRTNIHAMFYLTKAAIRHMKEGGTIINTTSIQSYQPSPELLHHASTKGAITTFTKGLAASAIKQGVRVNAVAPGPVWTPLITSTMPPEKYTTFGQQSLMGRPAQPFELAPSYVFLASQDSSFITGEIIGVTGGSFLS